MWGVGVFLSHERSNTSGMRTKWMQTEREKKRKTVGLHCKQRLPWALHKVHMKCRPKKKKKLITFTDGYPIQGKCQKDSHDSQSTFEKEHSMDNTMDLQMVICARRWWKAHHKCLCIILFSGTKQFVCVKVAADDALPFGRSVYICCIKI